MDISSVPGIRQKARYLQAPYEQLFIKKLVDKAISTRKPNETFCSAYNEFRKTKSITDLPEVWQFLEDGRILICEVLPRTGSRNANCMTEAHQIGHSQIMYGDSRHAWTMICEIRFFNQFLRVERGSDPSELDDFVQVGAGEVETLRRLLQSCGPAE